MTCQSAPSATAALPVPTRRTGRKPGRLGLLVSCLLGGGVMAQPTPAHDGGSEAAPTPTPKTTPTKPADSPPARSDGAAPTAGKSTPRLTLRGSVLLADGSPPKQAVVFVEGVAASAFSVPSAPLVISQRGARFRPDFSVAVVGQLVELPNDDRIIHNVFSVSPVKKFDLGHYGQGEKRSLRFERSGAVELFCGIHETMQGLILVVPSPHFALVSPDGSFSIAALPPGKYQLVAQSRSGSQARSPLLIGAEDPPASRLTLAGP